MLRPSPLRPCRRAYPCSPPFTACESASTIRRIHPVGTALLARPGCPTLTDSGSFKRPLSGPFDGLTRSDLGQVEPLPIAWPCDRSSDHVVAVVVLYRAVVLAADRSGLHRSYGGRGIRPFGWNG